MVPILYKYVSVYIKYLHYVMVYKPHIHRRSEGGWQGAIAPPKFLDLFILCFKRQYLKQNTVARLKPNILTRPKFWAGHATVHVSI